MVSEGAMRHIALDNITRLRSIQTNANFIGFVRYLKIGCSNAKVIKKDTAITMCLLMLTCNNYDFNPYNIKCLDAAALESYWRATSNARSMFGVFNANAALEVDELIMNRNILSFQKFMKSIKTDGLVSLTNPDRAASLARRQTAIRPSGMATHQLPSFAMCSATQITPPTAYRDYHEMIMSKLGYRDGRPILLNYKVVTCDCSNKITGLNVESNSTVRVCPDHGVQAKCRVALMKTRSNTLLMYGSQCRYPSKHLDRCMVMPLKIQDEVSQLLNSMNYFEIRSFRRTDGDGLVILSTNGGKSNRLREMRQYLSIGSCMLGDITAIVWMIRPTINYMKCIFTCRADQYNSVTSAIRGVVSARVPDTDVQRNLSFEQKAISADHIAVTVSGTLASHMIQANISNEVGAKISSVSMGGSTLNITLLRNDSLGRLVIDPVIMNSKLVGSLMSDSSEDTTRVQVTKEIRKCTMKFKRVAKDAVAGPSLTIGENGGFQWVGNPGCLSSTMLQAFTHMSNRMSSVEFKAALSRSQVGVLGAYPSGVPKR